MATKKAKAKKKPKAPKVKIPTVPEALLNLKTRMWVLKAQLARGGKSDIDVIGARLDELIADTQVIIDHK